ncbi:MAG TPA: DUF6797 domain-containing protein, partial [Planctomycetota bacterium]|nr:DUF6797 domain-containing protein [Planctomycetota bacterium]
RIAAMNYGQFLSSSLETPSGTVAKGISIRLGERGEAAVCFDSGARSLACGWTGGFLDLSSRRFGLIEMPRIAGSVVFSAPSGPGWAGGAGHYRGLHVYGRRVVLEYVVNGARVRESPWVEEARGIQVIARTLEMGPFSRPQTLHALRVKPGGRLLPDSTGSFAVLEEENGLVTAMAITGCREARIEPAGGARLDVAIPACAAAARLKLLLWRGSRDALPDVRALASGSPEPEDLAALLRPGPPRWGAPLETRGVLGAGEGPYVIDTLTVPHENPHRALLYLSGHDFFSNGDAAVSTVHGDVWTVSGIDARLEKLAWRRFATGLYQPLGLRIVEDEVHVLGRDQITRLHDLDRDGEADFYECFSNDSMTSPAGHDYHTCLETDAEGRFYYLSPRGLHRVSRDGRTQETIASGWRNPNGLSLGPGGTITVAPQEGEWTPASQICEVKSGGYYGYPGPRPGADRPAGQDPPLCWIPRHVDNSTGGQVWVTGGRWGPLEGQLLNLSFGRSSMQLVLRDTSCGIAQGAVVPMKGRFLSGAMRGRFRPEDGQLYVTGLMGWVTNAIRDGCFQRVRYTGGKVHHPTGFSVHSNGIRLGFAEPLDAASASDAGNWSARQWSYRYAEAYGSEEYSVAHAGQVGHDPVAIASASLLDDGRSVFVEIPSIRPVMQLHLEASLRSREGADVAFDLYATIHGLGPAIVLEAESDASPGAEVLGEDLDEKEEPAGLALTITSSRTGASDTRVSRLAALRVPEGSSPGPFLEPGPFRAVWSGHLSLDESGRLELSAAGRGRLKLSVDGRVLLEGEGDDLSRIGPGAARLRRGRRPITVEYDAPGRGDAWLRLYWSGKDFARETIPETALSHPRDAPGLARGLRLREGRRLVAELRCLGCHAPESEAWRSARGMPELGEDAPSLVDIGSRLEEGWMAAWIGDPARLRPSARMPDLVEAGSSEARDMAAYLAALRGGGGDEPAPEPGASSSAGGELFARLGCIACHTRPDDSRDDPGDGRLALRRVVEKWQVPALRDFLLEPSRRYRSTRMPDFKLTPDEAGALGDFLLAAAPARVPTARLSGSPGDPAAGKVLVQTRGCLNCHELPLENRFRAPSLEAVLRAAWSGTGCVATEMQPEFWPRFRLSDDERHAIRDFAAGGLAPLFREDLAEAANRSVDALRCTACHERAGRQPFWASVADETGSIASRVPSPITVQSRPSLTFTGEQLGSPWLRRFIAGELGYTLRPWLDARMPAFPGHADVLARGLALDHGCSPEDAPERPASPELLEAAGIGKLLLGAAQGFSCVSCHPVGREPAQMQLHFGAINLKHSRERLRHEHYLRWMLNPQRIDPLSVMPAYTEEDGRSVLTQLLGGHGPLQFEAIWQYLGTVR